MHVDRQTDTFNEANGCLSLFILMCLKIGPMFRQFKSRTTE